MFDCVMEWRASTRLTSAEEMEQSSVVPEMYCV